MNRMERLCLEGAARQVAYQRSYQARIDAENDRLARAARDVANGHLPACTLTRCHPACTHGGWGAR